MGGKGGRDICMKEDEIFMRIAFFFLFVVGSAHVLCSICMSCSSASGGLTKKRVQACAKLKLSTSTTLSVNDLF